MIVKFTECKSYFNPFELYKFTHKSNGCIILKSMGSSRLDGYPIFKVIYSTNTCSLDKYDYRFKFKSIEVITQLEDNISILTDGSRNWSNKKSELYDLMCVSFGIDKDSYQNEGKFKESLRKIKIENLLNSLDINDI